MNDTETKTRKRPRASRRVKAPPPFIARQQFEQAVDTAAQIQLDLADMKTNLDLELQAVRERYGPHIKAYQAEIKEQVTLCAAYAAEHRKDLLPGPSKSGSTSLAKFGFRKGQPTLKPRSKMTWEKVKAAIKKRAWITLLRTTVTVDKQAILKICRDDQLAKIGLRKDQVESFYVEAKTDDQPDITTSANGR